MPRGLRIAAVLSLFLTCMSGSSAAQDVAELANLQAIKQQHWEARTAQAQKSPEQELLLRVAAAQLAAVEPLSESRSVVLGLLAITCAVSFVAAARLLRPAGVSRERMRRVLGVTALVAAVLRTIDGAQLAVVMRNVVPPMSEALRAYAAAQNKKDVVEAIQAMVAALPTSALLLAAVQTALMAGAFALLSQYFRSQRVRDTVVALDGPPSDLD